MLVRLISSVPKLAFTLTCIDPDCGALFDAFVVRSTEVPSRCPYGGGELADISFTAVESAPDEDGPDVQLVVRHGPWRKRRAR